MGALGVLKAPGTCQIAQEPAWAVSMPNPSLLQPAETIRCDDERSCTETRRGLEHLTWLAARGNHLRDEKDVQI
jgi:hypothetical protein